MKKKLLILERITVFSTLISLGLGYWLFIVEAAQSDKQVTFSFIMWLKVTLLFCIALIVLTLHNHRPVRRRFVGSLTFLASFFTVVFGVAIFKADTYHKLINQDSTIVMVILFSIIFALTTILGLLFLLGENSFLRVSGTGKMIDS